MKKCGNCHKNKIDEAFGKFLSGVKVGKLQAWCKLCSSNYSKERHKKNPKRYLRNNKLWKKKRWEMWVEFKRGKKCNRCGFDNLAALEFYHPNGNKEFGVGALRYSKNWGVLMKEVEKCEVLCANCHRIEHWQKNYEKCLIEILPE